MCSAEETVLAKARYNRFYDREYCERGFGLYVYRDLFNVIRQRNHLSVFVST